AKRDEVTKAAEPAAAPARAEGLRRILDHAQLVAPRDVVEPVAIDRQAGEIDRDDRARRARHGAIERRKVDVARARIDVDEYRTRTDLEHDVRRRDPRERRGEHLVPLADAGEPQGDFQRRGARVEAAYRPAAAQARERRFQAFHLRTGGDP